MCLVQLHDVDTVKVDGGNLVGVIISINPSKSTAKVAVKDGLLKQSYSYHKLSPVNANANNPVVNDLEESFQDWQGIAKISEREAACILLSVGGQGVVKCCCKGDCMSKRCACFWRIESAALVAIGIANAARTMDFDVYRMMSLLLLVMR